ILLFSRTLPAPFSTLFPYTTLFRSLGLFPKMFLKAGAPDFHFGSQQRHVERFLTILGELFLAEAEKPEYEQLTAEDAKLEWLNRSEEHTSELQSRGHLVCRLLLEKK